MENRIAIKADELDNVATVFAEGIANGTELEIRDKKGRAELVSVIGNIPYGHKIATSAIRKGENVIKYGETIGAASADIARGEYVHVHNMEALRGRGDRREA